MTSAGIDWQREKWQSGLGSKFIHQGEKNAAKYADEVIVLSKGVQDYFKETYVIPTLGVWDKFEDIDFGELPDKFVLKCTHDSGGLVICKDKKKLDMKAAKTKINKSLQNNYYMSHLDFHSCFPSSPCFSIFMRMSQYMQAKAGRMP